MERYGRWSSIVEAREVWQVSSILAGLERDFGDGYVPGGDFISYGT